jgi:hypothetical protein
LREKAFSARACSDIAFAASTWRNALRASRSALEICFGGSCSPGVFVIGFPIFLSRSRLSVWPIYSDVPEFLRTFKEATLTAGLIVRTCCGIRHVVYHSTCHFARPLFLAFLGLVTFRLTVSPISTSRQARRHSTATNRRGQRRPRETAGRSPRWIKVKNRAHPAFSRVLDQF